MKIKALGYLPITEKYLLNLNRHLASSDPGFFKNPVLNQQMWPNFRDSDYLHFY